MGFLCVRGERSKLVSWGLFGRTEGGVRAVLDYEYGYLMFIPVVTFDCRVDAWELEVVGEALWEFCTFHVGTFWNFRRTWGFV